MTNKTVTAKELRLGDVVQLFDGPYGTAHVRNITDTLVTFYRPYGTCTDFSCTAGVICYVGIEEYSELLESSKTFTLWHHNRVR